MGGGGGGAGGEEVREGSGLEGVREWTSVVASVFIWSGYKLLGAGVALNGAGDFLA